MKKYNEIKDVSGKWIAGQPTTDGQVYRTVMEFSETSKGYEEKTYYTNKSPTIPVFPVTEVIVIGHKRLRRGIYDVDEGVTILVQGQVGLPDTPDEEPFMVMLQKLKDGNIPIEDDLRFEATIRDSVFRLHLKLPTGNYRLSQDRLNLGLANIGIPIKLQFDDIEFDSIVVI
jgi:hypothetical protein